MGKQLLFLIRTLTTNNTFILIIIYLIKTLWNKSKPNSCMKSFKMITTRQHLKLNQQEGQKHKPNMKLLIKQENKLLG